MGTILSNLIKGDDTMSPNKNMQSKNQSNEANSENSKNSKSGYMSRGNASKTAAEQGTRNR
jgi:hypothetical protein